MSDESKFSAIMNRLVSSVYALRVFSTEIVPLAQNHDKGTLKELSGKMLIALGADPAYVEQLDWDEIQGNNSGTASEESPNDFEAVESFKRFVDQRMQDPKIARAFIDVVKTMQKRSPIQTFLLRQGVLINLLIYLETMLSDLIHLHYMMFPGALPADDRSISLADLRRIGSIQDAERQIVDAEVEIVLRKNTKDQIEYLAKRLHVDTAPVNPYLEHLVEISQRRNLLVHNRGVVNATYLGNVSPELASAYGVSEGCTVEIDSAYMRAAIDTVYLCGVILGQQCWRKWRRDEGSNADIQLLDLTYDNLCEERYHLTAELAKYAGRISFCEDRSCRVIIINHAIALKQMGKIEEMEAVLAEQDWSSSALEFRVALAALHNAEDDLVEALDRAIPAESIGREALEKWPLFNEFRQSPHYKEVLSKHFPVM